MASEQRRWEAAERILAAEAMDVPDVEELRAELARLREETKLNRLTSEDWLQRLWTPYRMAYIKAESAGNRDDDAGCPLCRIPTLDDESGLVVARGEQVYAVLN